MRSCTNLIFPNPSVLEVLAGNAFCSINAKNFNLPSSLRYINDGLGEDGCFSRIRVSEFRFNDGLLYLGDITLIYSFISKVYLPSSLISIKYRSISYITDLKEIVTEGESTAFSIVDNILYNADKTILYSIPTFYDGEIRILDGVLRLSKASFCFSNVRSVIIPDSVMNIDNLVFWHCLKLIQVTIPYSYNYFNPGIFSNCPILSKLIIRMCVINDLRMSSFHISSIIIGEKTEIISSNAFSSI